MRILLIEDDKALCQVLQAVHRQSMHLPVRGYGLFQKSG